MTSANPGGLGGLIRDPDEAERRIDQWAQGFAEKAQRYQAAQERAEQLRLSATNSDGSVRVTVRADGSVSDLAFTEKVRSMPLTELSAQILNTMQKAQANIAGEVGAVMSEQLGDEDAETRSVMLENLRTRFPEPPEVQEIADPSAERWASGEEPPAAEPPRAGQPPMTPPPMPPSTPPGQPPHQGPPGQPPAPRNRPRPRPDDYDNFDDGDPLRD